MNNRVAVAGMTLILALHVQIASAQPVFDQSYIANVIGTTVEGATYEAAAGQDVAISALFDLTGANQTWDLTGLTFEAGESYASEYLALPKEGLLGSDDPAFADADYAIRTSGAAKQSGVAQYVAYFGVSATEHLLYGSYSQDDEGMIQPYIYDMPYLQHPFPLEFEAEWEAQATVTTDTGLDPPFDKIVTTYERDGVINGWGTLITPAGSVQVLREELTDRITFPGGTPIETRSVQFITDQGINASIFLAPGGLGFTYSLTYSVDGGGGGTQAPTDAPASLVPADGASSVAVDPSLSWGPVAGADTYDLQVADNSSFTKTGRTSTIIVDETGLTATTFDVSGLDHNATYYWRVRGVNAGGEGPWAATQSFTTVSNVAVERLESAVPDDFRLHDNYPNPFNPTTTIRFDLPESVPVRLSVFDALGREVDVLVTEQLQPGRYEYVWDAGDRPSGVFLFRLVAGAFVRTGSMVLLK